MVVLNALDDFYLSITLLITVGYQLFFFAIAWTFHFDKLTDFAGGTNFVILAIITLAMGSADNIHARNVVASLFVMLWGIRLSGFLLFRILKTGKDDRFDDKRDHFFKFLGFWVFQMLWVWTVSLPVTILNSPNVSYAPYGGGSSYFNGASDIVGVVFFAIGFLVEAIADVQKYRFRSSNQDPNVFMDRGLWSWSRHPNYFGEMLLWLGIWLICVTPAIQGFVSGRAAAALYASVVGPAFLTLLLMFVSGLPLQEIPTAQKRYQKCQGWEAYQEYLRRTSILFPVPPAIYTRMPNFLKRTVLLEFPMYVFKPSMEDEAERRKSRDGNEVETPRGSESGLTGGHYSGNRI